MLPHTDMDTYWAEMYRQPVSFYRAALWHIRDKHALPSAEATRFLLGRNLVFAWGRERVVKLVPPFWQPDVAREVTALRLVQGRLELATPEPLATGQIGTWGYLVMRYLPGEGLSWDLSDFGVAGRVRLAYRQGELLRRLQEMAIAPEHRDALAFDWRLEVENQRQEMTGQLRAAGIAEPLVESAGAYVEEAGDLASEPSTFLHGDLSAFNFTLNRDDGRLEVLGLLDFSDAALGPADHEYISPVMHQFRGEPEVLKAFWKGAGIETGNDPLQHRVMARSLLKYPDLMGRYLERLPGAPVTSWEEAARRFCRLT